jgi:hypothetical protein
VIESAVQVGSDGAGWPIEEAGDLGERQVLVEPENNDGPLTRWETAQLAPGLVDVR